MPAISSRAPGTSLSASQAWLNHVALSGPDESATVASTILRLRRRVGRRRAAVRTSTISVACSPIFSSAGLGDVGAVAVAVRQAQQQVAERRDLGVGGARGELGPDAAQRRELRGEAAGARQRAQLRGKQRLAVLGIAGREGARRLVVGARAPSSARRRRSPRSCGKATGRQRRARRRPVPRRACGGARTSRPPSYRRGGRRTRAGTPRKPAGVRALSGAPRAGTRRGSRSPPPSGRRR